jgi:transketolase N-terminal domain/subunit
MLDRPREMMPISPRSCALQYIVLHLLGYKLTLDDLKAFRQVDSLTPGHPEAHHTDGQEHLSLWYYAYTYMRFRD